MRVLGFEPPVAVSDNLALVARAALRVLDVLHVVAYRDHELVGHELLGKQLHRQRVGHLAQDYSGFLRGVRLVQHLPGAEAVGAGLVRFDCLYGAGFASPGVVYEQLGVLAEKLEEKLLVRERAARHVAHREHPVLFELLCVTPAHAPEVRERRVAPQLAAVAALVQLRNSHAVFVGGDVLGHDVHGDLAEIKVRPYPRRRRDAGGFEHVEDYLHRQVVRREAVGLEIARHVHEHLVYRVDDDVLRGDVFHVHLVNARAVLHVIRHARRGYEEVHGERWVRLKLGEEVRLALQPMPRRVVAAARVRLAHALLYLKEAAAASNAVAFQARRHGEADCLVRSALIGDDEVRVQRVKPPLPALDRGVKALEVYCDVCPLHVSVSSFPFLLVLSVLFLV